ncbi:hypothetical protein BCF53_110154 [Reinekea marinisedimentorum]|uniref:Uncharacterized protein n=2 Tax=Reinekea marinisedimentorum TaxID=230495 RepID=A0A4R3I7W3_9GAMM|nr:hypothetical protein BCF53_110154 [Reinekea marinisedimentorum]
MASSFDGFVVGTSVNSKNISEIAKSSWEYAKASTTQKKYDDGFAKAFYLVDETNQLFSLSESNVIYLTDFESRSVDGVWTLSRWQYLTPPPAISLPLKEEFGINFRGKLYQNPNDLIYKIPSCMRKSPLRYGDIEGDGEFELYLALLTEHVVLSPLYGGVVFSFMPFADDWVASSLEGEYVEFIDQLGGSDYQYISSRAISRNYIFAAHRSYTKLFEGDFDGDNNPDLVTWQKVYRSNTVGGIKGFSLISEVYTHYERDLDSQKKSVAGVTGEYLPQKTYEPIIQSWLSESDFTWSKGYPSISECEGEEGELIPEMHDPLLNDPDVLQ